MNAGAGGVTAALLIGAGRDARLCGRLAGLNRSVVDADRTASTTTVPTTVATTTADATVMTTGRRTEEPRETTFGTATFRTTAFTHSRATAVTTTMSTTGVLRNAGGQTGVEGGLAVGFDGAFSRLAGLEGLEARVDGSA